MTNLASNSSPIVKSRPDWLRWMSLILAGLGVADAIYLTWIKIQRETALFCVPGGGCDIVNTSPYSELAGIPIAVFGLGMYLVILAILLVDDRWAYGRQAVFGLALTGTLYSAYLTYLELAVIHAVCPYCVISALLVTALLVLAIIRLRQPVVD
jgi:uncharacterized membrane protein